MCDCEILSISIYTNKSYTVIASFQSLFIVCTITIAYMPCDSVLSQLMLYGTAISLAAVKLHH